MSKHHKPLAQLLTDCWEDEKHKSKFMADPKAVLAKHGIDLPENIEVHVAENPCVLANKTSHFTCTFVY